MRRNVELPLLLLIIGLSLTLLTTTGCDSSTSETTGVVKVYKAGTDDAHAASLTDTSPEVTAADVEFVDKAGFDQFLAKHKGKVIFVDYWATWCGTCKEQFPHTVELQRKFGDKGLIEP